MARFGVSRGAHVEFVRHGENTTYGVTDPDGRRFALRINRPGYQTREAIRSELAWMESLSESGVRTPPPRARNRRGPAADRDVTHRRDADRCAVRVDRRRAAERRRRCRAVGGARRTDGTAARASPNVDAPQVVHTPGLGRRGAGRRRSAVGSARPSRRLRFGGSRGSGSQPSGGASAAAPDRNRVRAVRPDSQRCGVRERARMRRRHGGDHRFRRQRVQLVHARPCRPAVPARRERAGSTSAATRSSTAIAASGSSRTIRWPSCPRS